MTTPKNAPIRIFVYGTRMRGEPNHHYLAQARFLGEARTEPAYTLVSLGAFPAMVPGGQTSVVGELYEIERRTLASLDRLEGHPHFYRRCMVRLEHGTAALTYVFVAARSAHHSRVLGNN